MMKKQEILDHIDAELINKVFGFCHEHTDDSYEAQELCSDIIYALVKTASTDGEIADLNPLIWRIAENAYFDYVKHKKRQQEVFCEGNPEEIFALVSEADAEESSRLLETVYRQIAFLTRTYREVMIQFYIDGLSMTDIARIQNTTETNVRKKLMWARGKVKCGVRGMERINDRPLVFAEMNYNLWGYGKPDWGDPREIGIRTLSKHIIWLCRSKPRGAAEIAEQLNVPTAYIEEELEVLASGTNGEYGLLRRTGNNRYVINFVLLDRAAMKKAAQIYMEQMPGICRIIAGYAEKHRTQYAEPEFDPVLRQQLEAIERAFCDNVERILAERYFADCREPDRPFSIFGHVAAGGTQCAVCGTICPMSEGQRLFDVSGRLSKGYFEKEAQETAERLAALIRRSVPKHLLGEWRFVSKLAAIRVFEHIAE
ncbi:MAG: sigma-70 family RNA polymerase sigma factor [Lachnospiraceae bacterium]|nr:sigma-70 family RNA polymerase sigma factor [Lachnospiraceae bacterium]